MITRLRLSNFKCHREVDLRLAPITAFFGANSSGKTSLLQALLLLKQTAASADRASVLDLRGERDGHDAGTFRDLIWGHDAELTMAMGVDWRPGRALREPTGSAPRVRTHDVAFDTRLVARAPANGQVASVVVERMGYRDGVFGAGMASNDAGYVLTWEGHDPTRAPGKLWPLRAPVKCYGFPEQVAAYYRKADYYYDLQFAFEQLWSGLYHLGPLRARAQRSYRWTGTRAEDVGPLGERFVDMLLGSRGRKPGLGRGVTSLESYIGRKLRDLGLLATFELRPLAPDSDLYQAQVKVPGTRTEVLLPDVGVGVEQVLPVLVLCYGAPAGSTIILEQPEIHLHPAVQSGLADILIDAAQRRGVQIIVESHSEHLLRRLQRRIAENAQPAEGSVATPEGIAMYFCEMVDGAARVTELALDEFGDIGNWPRDFFGDEFGEIGATVRAQMARRQVGAP